MADRWIAEIGETAACHFSRKLGELKEWGDSDGSKTCRRILKAIERRAYG